MRIVSLNLFNVILVFPFASFFSNKINISKCKLENVFFIFRQHMIWLGGIRLAIVSVALFIICFYYGWFY